MGVGIFFTGSGSSHGNALIVSRSFVCLFVLSILSDHVLSVYGVSCVPFVCALSEAIRSDVPSSRLLFLCIMIDLRWTDDRSVESI